MRTKQQVSTHVVVCVTESRADAEALAALVRDLCVEAVVHHRYGHAVRVNPHEWRSTAILREECVPGRAYHYTEIGEILEKHKFKASSAAKVCTTLVRHGIMLPAVSGPRHKRQRGFYAFPVKSCATDDQSQPVGPPPQAPSA